MLVGWLKNLSPASRASCSSPKSDRSRCYSAKMIQSGVHEQSPTPTGDLRWLRQRFAINGISYQCQTF